MQIAFLRFHFGWTSLLIRSIDEIIVLPARWQGFTESLLIRCMQYVDHAPQNTSGRDRYAKSL